MKRWLRRVRAAIRAYNNYELQERGLSFACAVIEHMELTETWGQAMCNVLADEARLRKLGAYEDLTFTRTTDGIRLAQITPPTQL